MSSSARSGNRPCVACRGETFTWGHLRGVYGPTSFVPRDPSSARGLFANILGKGGQTPAARACDACGNVQLFINHDGNTQ